MSGTALGTQAIPLIELTNAYAAMADSGKHVPYRSILRIVDSAGDTWDAPTPKPAQVISPQAAYMLTSVLADDKAQCLLLTSQTPCSFDYPSFQVASKTGTGSGKYGPSDIVTIGYSPYLAVGVWVGNANNADMRSDIIGIAGAGYIFHDVMDWAMKNYKWTGRVHSQFHQTWRWARSGCNAGLAPYQGEGGSTGGNGGNGAGTGTGTGTGSTGSAPMCSYRDDVPNHGVSIYGKDPGNPTPNIDWYIQGQAAQLVTLPRPFPLSGEGSQTVCSEYDKGQPIGCPLILAKDWEKRLPCARLSGVTRTGPLVLRQQPLAQADILRRHLDQLVVLMKSSDCSRLSFTVGERRTAISEVEERTFVAFFSLQTLTARSSGRAFSPTIMPS